MNDLGGMGGRQDSSWDGQRVVGPYFMTASIDWLTHSQLRHQCVYSMRSILTKVSHTTQQRRFDFLYFLVAGVDQAHTHQDLLPRAVPTPVNGGCED